MVDRYRCTLENPLLRSIALMRPALLACLMAGGLNGCSRPLDPPLAAPAPPPARVVRHVPPPAAAQAPPAAPAAMPAWARARTVREVPVALSDRVVALTFDDGPWPGTTRQVLDILQRHHVQATFFLLGSQVAARPALARAVRDAGHAVGNHSWSHPIHPADAAGEVRRTDAAMVRVLGEAPRLFRPPYGLLTNGLARVAKGEGDTVMLWSADTRDWSRPGSGRIAARAIGQASPGGIILMHDGGGNRKQTVAALPTIIERLQAKGYRFVTVPELLALRAQPQVVADRRHAGARRHHAL